MSEAVIELREVTKRFREHTAVDNLSLSVPEGSIFGFIGPNGSGKTTTLRMILNIIEQDSGEIKILGKRSSAEVNNEIAYLPEERGLYRKMTVLRQLIYFGQLKGLSRANAKLAAESWLDRLDLLNWKNKKLETLSKGMSQKIQFIATVIASPKLIILDEPFSGLDPVNLETIRGILLDLKREGSTLIFSTHDMHTAEEFCDRIGMIYNGKMVLDGTIDEIQEKYGEDTIRLRVDGLDRSSLDSLEGVDSVRELGQVLEVRYSQDPQVLLQTLISRGKVRKFEIVHPSLQDIFVRIARPKKEDIESLKGEGTDNA